MNETGMMFDWATEVRIYIYLKELCDEATPVQGNIFARGMC